MSHIEAEIETLTRDWCAQIGGMNLLVPVGAALNVLTTCGNHAAPEVRQAMIDFLRVVANKLDGQLQ